jgi:hypothetical protein
MHEGWGKQEVIEHLGKENDYVILVWLSGGDSGRFLSSRIPSIGS